MMCKHRNHFSCETSGKDLILVTWNSEGRVKTEGRRAWPRGGCLQPSWPVGADGRRLCRPGCLHQPQHQSGSDAAPDQPDGRPQLWAPALVQAAERRQCGGPQVRLPGVSRPSLWGTQVGGSSLVGGEENRRALTGLCSFQPD